MEKWKKDQKTQEKEEKKELKRLEHLDAGQQEAFMLAAISGVTMPVKQKALSRLSDQSMLAKVAIQTKLKQVRIAVLDKMTDVKALQDVAQNMIGHSGGNRENEDRNYEISHLFAKLNKSDYILMKKIFETAADPAIRREAAQYVALTTEDENELIEIAKKSPDGFTRQKAIKRIFNQPFLFEVAKSDDDFTARYAIENLTVSEYLVELVRNSNNREKIEAAFRNPHFTSQHLVELICSSKDRNIRSMAIRNPSFTNQEMLADIAKNDADLSVASTACVKLGGHKLDGCTCTICRSETHDFEQVRYNENNVDHTSETVYKCRRCGKTYTSTSGDWL